MVLAVSLVPSYHSSLKEKLCSFCKKESCKPCKSCGLGMCVHHPPYPPVKSRCVCDPEAWEDPSSVPDACDAFEGDEELECERCEHMFACHKPK